MILAGFFMMPANAQDAVSLFDGETMSGWHSVEQDFWRVEDGALTGGSLDKMIEENTFLVSEHSYQNFELVFKVKLLGTEGFVNSGFQVRSMSVIGSSAMSGYQVDAGDEWWGKLYDESRRDMVIAESANMDAIDKTVIRGQWNEYRILAQGRRIRSWINGVTALDYVEEDLTIPQNGYIGIQAHGGGKSIVQVKDISIKVLEDTPGITLWTEMPVHSPQ